MTLSGAPKDLDIALPAVTEYANTAPSYFWEIKKAVLSEVDVAILTVDTTLDITHSTVHINKASAISITLPAVADVSAIDKATKRYLLLNVGAGVATIVGTVYIKGTFVNKAATMTIASPCVVTSTAHGYSAGDMISFATTGALPTGVVAGTVYYVLAPTDDTFTFSATLGGAAVNSSGTQSGAHTVQRKNEPTASPTLSQGDLLSVWSDGTSWHGAYVYLAASNKKVWDGAAWRNASATPAANTVPVSNGDGDLNDWVSGLFPFTQRQFTNAARQVVTLTLAAPCVATKIGHGYSAGDPIVFSTTGTLPTGVESEEDGTIYYVLAPAADTFTFAATPGGTAINGSVSQSGTHKVQEVDLFTIPTGITRVWAFMRGGGAGGSGGTDINFGGGGGGAGYPVFWYPINVTPGDVLYHVNGNGGLAGGYQAAGAAGASTWIGKVGTGKISVDAGGGQPGGTDKTGGTLGSVGFGSGSSPSIPSGGVAQADYIDGPMFNQFARTSGMASGATANSTSGGNGGGPGGGIGGADNNHGGDATANSGSGGGGGGAQSGTNTAGGSGAYGYAWLAYW